MRIIKTTYNTGGFGKHPEKLNGILPTNYPAEPARTRTGKTKSGGTVLALTTFLTCWPWERLSTRFTMAHKQYNTIVNVLRAKLAQDDRAICLMDALGLNSQGMPSNLLQPRALLQPKSCPI